MCRQDIQSLGVLVPAEVSQKNDNHHCVYQRPKEEDEAVEDYDEENILELSLSRDSDFEELSHQLLEKQQPVKALTLKKPIHEEEPDWNSDSLRKFVLDVASLKHLERIELQNFGLHSNSLPLYTVATLLSTTSPLKIIHLNCVSFIGTRNDMEALAGSLRQQPTLECFRMSYCGFSSASCHNNLDPILRALSSLTSLKTLEIWSLALNKLGTLQANTLRELVGQSKSLRSLHIEGFALVDIMIQELALALRHNTSLERLDVHALKGSHLGAMALAQSLADNQTLQSLELFLSHDNEEDQQANNPCFLTTLANALTTNQSLRELRVHCYQKVTGAQEEAFATMLEHNSTLQFLHLANYQGDSRPKIEYYLSWNRRGRRQGALSEHARERAALLKSKQQEVALAKKKRGKRKTRRQDLNRPCS